MHTWSCGCFGLYIAGPSCLSCSTIGIVFALLTLAVPTVVVVGLSKGNRTLGQLACRGLSHLTRRQKCRLWSGAEPVLHLDQRSAAALNLHLQTLGQN
jgi:hypothetical protein